MVAVWCLTTSVVGAEGIRLFVGSDASNFHEWEMASLTGDVGIQYNGGWVRMVVDLNTPPDATTGSPDMANADYFALEFDVDTDIMGNIKTVWIDQMDILTAADIVADTVAIEVIGTTATTGEAITEIAALATVLDLGGIVKSANGSFDLNLPIKFGDVTSTDSTFTSTNEYCFIPKHRFEPEFLIVEFDGGTGTDAATWGSESGSGDNTLGATGGAFIGDDNFRLLFDASDITTIFAGVVIDGASSISLSQTNVRLVSCTIVNCGQIALDVGAGATLRDSVVTDSIETLSSHTGSSDLDFNDNGGSDDTIVRPSGDFIADGFEIGDVIIVSGTSSNDGLMTLIAPLTTTTLTVITGTIVDEQNTSGKVESKGSGAIKLVGNPAGTADFRDMLIQNCVHGIENDVNGAITWDLRNVVTANNTQDIRFNHASGLLTVNVLEGSSTFTTSDGLLGGTISIVASNPIDIKVVEGDFTTDNPGARVGVHRADNNAELLNLVTDANGEVSGTTTFAGAVIVKVRDEAFNYKRQPATIVSGTGLSLTIAAEDDDKFTPT